MEENLTMVDVNVNSELENDEEKKDNLFVKLGKGIVNGAKITGEFIGKHKGAIITTSVITVAAVAALITSAALGDQGIDAILNKSEDDNVVDEVKEDDKIVEFEKAI